MITQKLPLSLYDQAMHRFYQAVEQKQFGGVVVWGMIPLIGPIPSSVAAVYTAARTVDRLAAYCFTLVRASRDQEGQLHNPSVKNVEEDLVNYFVLFVGVSIGTCTFGLSYLPLISIDLDRSSPL